MDRSYYASIEVGQRNVSLSNLKKITDGFHITISKLMCGVE
ncbi:MAG: helix-turn-helix transcriptional regulator [Collinsella sp.]|nr:helix-turn-helix transcriptional regulator [Collinsella sp.]MEE1436648.1 helix-turn-helix transcriptional regulator [Collinsella sp.]